MLKQVLHHLLCIYAKWRVVSFHSAACFISEVTESFEDLHQKLLYIFGFVQFSLKARYVRMDGDKIRHLICLKLFWWEVNQVIVYY
jgi:hypothetical protein